MSWQYSDNEYIKLFRKMLDWEWYTDVNTTKLFVHCLLKANWKDGSWHGYKYKRGEFITSLPTLAKETGLSIGEIRTALMHLKSTGELADKKFPKFRIITVLSYDSFQGINRQNNSQTTGKSAGSQQADDRQSTADIRSIRSINNLRSEEEAPAPDDQSDWEPEDYDYEGNGWTQW